MAQSLSLKTLHLAGKINMVPKKENHSKCARHSEKGKANGGLEQSEIPWRKWALSWTLQSATLHAHGRHSEWMPVWLHLPLSSDQTQRYKKPDQSTGVKAQDNTHLASGMAGVGVEGKELWRVQEIGKGKVELLGGEVAGWEQTV